MCSSCLMLLQPSAMTMDPSCRIVDVIAVLRGLGILLYYRRGTNSLNIVYFIPWVLVLAIVPIGMLGRLEDSYIIILIAMLGDSGR